MALQNRLTGRCQETDQEDEATFLDLLFPAHTEPAASPSKITGVIVVELPCSETAKAQQKSGGAWHKFFAGVHWLPSLPSLHALLHRMVFVSLGCLIILSACSLALPADFSTQTSTTCLLPCFPPGTDEDFSCAAANPTTSIASVMIDEGKSKCALYNIDYPQLDKVSNGKLRP